MAKVINITLTPNEDTAPIKLPLPSDFNIRIDSNRPYIYLPTEACLKISKRLQLMRNNQTNDFLINDEMHTNYLKQNPSLQFHLASIDADSITANIKMSYTSLGLQLGFPSLPQIGQQTHYFPMRCTDDSKQYVLG